MLSPSRNVLLAIAFALPALAIRADGDRPMKSCRIHYSGKVQGVGFRATAAEIARDYPVQGWVKNLADGRVELFVQGPEADVEKFLQAIRKRWKDNITKEQVEKATPDGKLKGFEVVR